MRNPFRTEAAAFRFVGATIVYFVLIAFAATAGNVWWGLGVFVLLSLAAGWWLMRSLKEEPAPPATGLLRTDDGGERRILVVANETLLGDALRDCILEKSGDRHAEVRVVAPALNSPLRHWVSDEDGARAAAQERLETSVERLQEAGFDASGEIGDGDPLQALEDALRTFGPDEVIISTHPVGRSHWLEHDIVESARDRFAVPITHVVVDLETEREEVQ
jgi:nucleotide-binding universal stress UspA family protein